ncbi:uncharacterized protein [Paramormyrops kingsleyae]|uniref:uncharacterized protein isoform X3 n=1 Tax=Paramormyrops kingsleyae TaxID=1676925 RepID=UPI003B973918
MDEDFELRRELRRQKREEMRQEAERMSMNNDDDEEAARERRRKARQERLRNKEDEESASMATESTEHNDTTSTNETETTTSSQRLIAAASEDDQALLERIAKREERRQRRMKEALERQKEIDPTITNNVENSEEEKSHGRSEHEQVFDINSKPPEPDSWKEKEVKKKEEEREEEKQEVTVAVLEEKETEPEKDEEKEEVTQKSAGSVLGEEKSEAPEKETQVAEEKLKRPFVKEPVTEKKTNKEPESLQRKKDFPPQAKQQNGTSRQEAPAACKLKKPEWLQSRKAEPAEKGSVSQKAEDLKRRRDEAESGEFEKMRQKQQEAEAELENLRRKREERKKVLEEEEKLKKQEQEEKKAKEEEEKRRMKEEIEKRRAEAAEKRQKVEGSTEGGSKKPFTCVSPKGSSLKIGERAEFLNKSAQKSAVKVSHTPIVTKIGNKLEQYNTAIQTNKDVKSPKSPAADLPVAPDGIRNIKSMWERGNVSGTPEGPGAPNKETAAMKIGVTGRINDWRCKTPEPGKAAGGASADLKPGDVTNKRGLWENKNECATKVTVGQKSKSVTNAGVGH